MYLVCFISIPFTLSSQELSHSGKDFWFAFPQTNDGVDPGTSYILNIASEVPTSGTISIPGKGYQKNFSVVPGLVTKVKLPNQFAVVMTNETIENQGINIVSNDDIVVYAHTYHMFRSDASLVLPVKSLGSEYISVSADMDTTRVLADKSEFVIIAPGTPVSVEITPTTTTDGGKAKGQPFIINLKAGEVYQVQRTQGHLSGSRIRSLNGEKIAVISGNRMGAVGRNGGSTRDPIFEQLYPVSAWGKDYIVVPTPNRKEDMVKIYASQDNTVITINGVAVATLNAQEEHTAFFSEPTLIKGDKPISTALFLLSERQAGGGGNGETTAYGDGDPALVMINPNEQMFLDTIPFYAGYEWELDTNYLNIVCRAVDMNNIRLNGKLLGGFKLLPADKNYATLSIGIDTGTHVLTTAGCGINAYVQGIGWAESYAYAAGSALYTLEGSIWHQSQACGGDIIFQSELGGAVQSIDWDFGDGNTSNEMSPTHTYSNGGTYKVSAIVMYRCSEADTLLDVVTVPASMNPKIIAVTNPGCGSNSGSATAKPGDGGKNGPYKYLWSNGEKTKTAVNLGAGSNSVTITNKFGCSASASVNLTGGGMLVLNSTVQYEDDCDRWGSTVASATVTPQSGTDPFTFLWNDATGQTTKTAIGIAPGQYIVTVTDGSGCSLTDTVLVEQKIQIGITVDTQPCTGCNNGEVTASVNGFGIPPFTYRWNEGNEQTSATAVGLSPGVYVVVVTDFNGCYTSDTISIGVTGFEDPKFADDFEIYPNPTKGLVRIDADQVFVYNAIGELILESDKGLVNLAGNSPGVYFVRALKGNRVYHSKVVLE